MKNDNYATWAINDPNKSMKVAQHGIPVYAVAVENCFLLETDFIHERRTE